MSKDLLKRLSEYRIWHLSFIAINLVLLYFLAMCFLIVHTGLHSNPRSADAVVIFGTSVLPDNSPSRLLRWRLDSGYEVWKAGLAPIIIVSGGQGSVGDHEADVMASYLEDKGVDSQYIIKDYRGESTFDTVISVSSMSEIDSLIIVSDYTHILRIKMILQKFGISEVSHVYSDIPYLSDIRILPREVAAITYNFFR